MNYKKIAALIATFLFAGTALSGEQIHHDVEIAVVTADGDGETRIELGSDELGFDLHDMQVGENRSVVDKEGRSILITRVESGFTFDVDGKTINMPAFESHDGAGFWNHNGDHVSNVDVHVVRDGMLTKSSDMDGVLIISGEEIDAATQQVIRSALESAGHGDVRFTDGSEGGQHQVRVIKKVVEVSE